MTTCAHFARSLTNQPPNHCHHDSQAAFNQLAVSEGSSKTRDPTKLLRRYSTPAHISVIQASTHPILIQPIKHCTGLSLSLAVPPIPSTRPWRTTSAAHTLARMSSSGSWGSRSSTAHRQGLAKAHSTKMARAPCSCGTMTARSTSSSWWWTMCTTTPNPCHTAPHTCSGHRRRDLR